ncbi:MAG: type II secretion system F family protein [Firmicutes bacterium]|nr:type II secretion system F family protein [Bacillota bacterium]
MSRFVYTARSAATGRKVRGALEAESLGALLARLHEAGYVPLSVRPENPWLDADVRKLLGLGASAVPTRDRALFFRQMATMLRAGLPLRASLRAAAEQAGGRIRQVAQGLLREIESGRSLHDAMRQFPDAFQPLHVALVRSGELSGTLDEVLERLAGDEERRLKTEGRIRSASAYPLFVLVVAVVVLAFMTYFIVPTFVGIFEQLQVPLPWTTRVLVALSTRPVYGYLFLVALAALAAAAVLYVRSPQGRARYDAWKLRAPALGPLVRLLALARLTRGLATMFRSGFPILEALEAAGTMAGNAVFESAMREVRRSVEQGSGLADGFRFAGAFPAFLVEMAAVGERTGALDELLDRAAAMYEAEAEERLSSLTSVLEPLLVLLMGGVIGFIALSVFLPMFSLISNVSKMPG